MLTFWWGKSRFTKNSSEKKFEDHLFLKNHYTCYYFYQARVINNFNLATFESLNNVITRSTYTHFLVVFSWIIYATLFELMCRQSREQGATHFEKLSNIIKRIGNILMIIH